MPPVRFCEMDFPFFRMVILFGLVFGLLACEDASLEATQYGSIEGHVRAFDTQASIAGANVTTSPATGSFVTDAAGDFRLSDVAVGTYTLTAKRDGFDPNTISVAVRAGEVTSAVLFLERSEDEDATTDSIAVNIVNWANRSVNADTTFVDIEYRVHNAGDTKIAAYEVYLRIETSGDAFFDEIEGDSLDIGQADIGTLEKFIRNEAAQDVAVDGVYVESTP